MAISTWLITGSSRGLGLEIVKQLVASPDNIVIAAARNPDKATGLQALKSSAKGTLHIVQLDVSSESAILASVKTVEGILGGKGLDYLYNNAGTLYPDEIFGFKWDEFLKTFETNVVAPAYLAQVYLPLIEKSNRKVIVNVSSWLSSIATDNGTLYATYCTSKTALNMVTYKQTKSRPDVISIALNPGWVKTEMGGDSAALEVPDSAAAQLKVVTSVTLEQTGKLLDYSGKVLPW